MFFSYYGLVNVKGIVFWCFLVILSLAVSAGAVNYLERRISEMTLSFE